jgi:hypothetical protein
MAGARVYRTRLVLRLAAGLAAVLWAVALVLVVVLPGAQLRTVASACAFLLLFLVASAVYDRSAITVTGDGIVVSGVWRRTRVRFDEISQVEIHPTLAGTLYQVRTRRGPVRFSSLFARHRELCALLIQESALLRTA